MPRLTPHVTLVGLLGLAGCDGGSAASPSGGPSASGGSLTNGGAPGATGGTASTTGSGGSAAAAGGGSGGAGACTDLPPDATSTCGEQVGGGQCEQPWMSGFCDRSCGRCPGIGNAVEACADVSPEPLSTCAQQADQGACGEAFMDGYCLAACGQCPVGPELIDPEASRNTRALMTYLVSIYRDQVLSGQQDREAAETIATLTGRSPAVLGLDFMDYSPSRVARGATSDATAQAIEWWRAEGGIVTVCWHWNAPEDLVDSGDWPWWRGFYTEGTTFDFATAMSDRESPQHALILRDIDAIAAELQSLETAGVPVLWRPLHEASGGWFWWGAHGPEPYLALWRLLYDRLVSHHGLHNLIWVWNGQDADWYPGDQYADIVSEDLYGPDRIYDPQEAAYLEATRYASLPKLVALSETGVLPDPDLMQPSRSRWSWFTLWGGEFATSEVHNEDTMKAKVYASSFVVTLDELPDLNVEGI